MFALSQPSAFRRRVAGLSLVAFISALVTEQLIDPANAGTSQALYHAAVDHRGRLVASALLLIASAVFFVPAIVGVVHLIRDRGVVLAHVGGAIALLGALGHMALGSIYLVVLAMPAPGNRTQMLALLDRLQTGTAAAVLQPLVISYGIGLLLLSVALLRARVVPRWVFATAASAVLIEIVLADSATFADLAKILLGVVAWCWLGARILTMSDTEWERPTRAAGAS